MERHERSICTCSRTRERTARPKNNRSGQEKHTGRTSSPDRPPLSSSAGKAKVVQEAANVGLLIRARGPRVSIQAARMTTQLWSWLQVPSALFRSRLIGVSGSSQSCWTCGFEFALRRRGGVVVEGALVLRVSAPWTAIRPNGARLSSWTRKSRVTSARRLGGPSAVGPCVDCAHVVSRRMQRNWTPRSRQVPTSRRSR
jgi:hypothetical protein